MPGLAPCTGGEIICSDAAIFCASAPLLPCGTGVLVPEDVVGDFVGAAASGVMVDCEEEREKGNRDIDANYGN